MNFITAICWLSMFAFGQAYVKPADLPDGAYYISLDAQGEAIGAPVLLGPINTTKVSARTDAQQEALPSSKTYCNTRSGFHGADYIHTWGDFNDLCDTGIFVSRPLKEKAGIIAVYYGDAVSYMCNYSTSEARCWRSEFNEANDLMNDKCGKGKPSWVVIDSYHKSYGRDTSSWDIC